MRAVGRACAAALGAAAYLLLDPRSADLAAQQYRAGLVRDHGLGLWDKGWFAGHHTPGYSVLSPPLGALLGVRLAGALAAFAAATLFARLAARRWGERAAVVAAACPICGLSGAASTGAYSRSGARRRPRGAQPTSSRSRPTSSRCTRGGPATSSCACPTRANGR